MTQATPIDEKPTFPHMVDVLGKRIRSWDVVTIAGHCKTIGRDVSFRGTVDTLRAWKDGTEIKLWPDEDIDDTGKLWFDLERITSIEWHETPFEEGPCDCGGVRGDGSRRAVRLRGVSHESAERDHRRLTSEVYF